MCETSPSKINISSYPVWEAAVTTNWSQCPVKNVSLVFETVTTKFHTTIHLTENSCVTIRLELPTLAFLPIFHPVSENRLGTTVAKTRALRLIGDFFVIKTPLAIALSVIITALSLPATAMAQSTGEVEKIRAKIQTLSANKDSQVQVKFRDDTKVKGYIDSVEPLSFNLRDPKDGTSQSIAYSEVDSVSKASGGMSTKTWLILGGVAAGAVTTWLIVKPAVCDGGAQTRGAC